jgi:homoserine O-acetyltransferase
VAHPPLAPGWIDRPHRVAGLGDLPLEDGGAILQCRLSWVEHGERNAAGDNTVLALCAIGSTHHRLDFLIGPGRALDPAVHHVIAIDALGNGLSSSPSNSKLQPGASFPRIGIRDMVASQRRLLEQLGITRLHAVIGASMGGMQALQWAACYPEDIERVVAMTPMARTTRWSQLVNEISRRMLFEDAACTRPRERAAAMALWAPFTQLVVPSTPQATERFAGKEALFAEISGLQARFAQHGPDPFDWACQTRAYDDHDLGATPGFGGDLVRALAWIRARVLVLAAPLDLYNPQAAARQAVAGIRDARLVEIPSDRGHRAAGDTGAEEARFLNDTIGRFLRETGDGPRLRAALPRP